MAQVSRFPMLVLMAGVILSASTASAGLGYIPDGTCYRYSDGSGYCYGFFKGFRNSAGPSDYAALSKNMYANGYIDLSFYAQVAGTGYSCYAPAGSFFAKQTDTLIGNEFQVSWNASGSCTNIITINDSIGY